MLRSLQRYGRPLAALAVAGLFALPGCGGGGGAASGGSSTLGVYVTDAFSDDYSQVWITLFKIEAKTDGGDWQTLFSDTTGKLIDVTSLADTAQLLSSISVPAGNYKQVRVTFGDHISLVPKAGGAAIDAQVADDIGVHAAGQVAITLAATTPVSSAQLSNLVVDFDLASFQLVGGKVRPAAKQGDDNQFHQKKHHAEIEGTVQGLVDGQSFSLLLEGGKVVPVTLTSTTQVFSEHEGTTATLANGQKVEVQGDVDPTTQAITATAVKVEDTPAGGTVDGHNENDHAQAAGAVASVDSATAFTLTLKEAEHFQPTGGTVSVQTNADTKFQLPGHDHPTMADVTAGAQVLVVGTVDPASQTITARFVLIKPASSD